MFSYGKPPSTQEQHATFPDRETLTQKLQDTKFDSIVTNQKDEFVMTFAGKSRCSEEEASLQLDGLLKNSWETAKNRIPNNPFLLIVQDEFQIKSQQQKRVLLALLFPK
jgi:hypothetical protein